MEERVGQMLEGAASTKKVEVVPSLNGKSNLDDKGPKILPIKRRGGKDS